MVKEPKIGVYNASVLPAVDGDLFKSLDLIAELGFKGVNFLHVNQDAFKALSEADQRRILTDYPQKLGLEVTSVSCNISSETEGDVEQRMKPLREAIDLCRECIVPMVIVHGGERIMEDEEENRAAWDRLVENMKHGGAYGAEHGVKVAMEPGGGVWMVHGWRLLNRLAQEVGDTFYVNLDPANITMACEDPVRGVEVLGDRIIHAHLKDARIRKPAARVKAIVEKLDDTASNLVFSEWYAAVKADSDNKENYWIETPVGEGDVDFKALIEALDKVGFDGWMTVEREGAQDGDEKVRNVKQARDHVLSVITE